MLGLEEFAGARRVCWGPKSLLGPEEFPGAQSRVWLEEFPGARKGNILIMEKEPFVKQLLFYSLVHTLAARRAKGVGCEWQQNDRNR